MIVLLHILIALTSVGYTTYVFFSPSWRKLQASYGLVALTVLSGTYLAVQNPSHLLRVCTVGLMYVGAVSVGLVAVHHKLAAIKSSDNSHS